MITDRDLALRYAPILHFDEGETIFPRAVGYTVFRESARSLSFPKREIRVSVEAAFVIEYAYYFDYDIEHMYDLEHIWVTIGRDGALKAAEASFHGKYLNLLIPELRDTIPPEDEHVHAFCQPGKHAFLPAGDLFRLVPGWETCCREGAGGPVLIGNPFCAEYSSTGKDLFTPTTRDDDHSTRYLRETLSFRPTLRFRAAKLDEGLYLPWAELFEHIPGWITAECRRLDQIYGEG